MYFIREGLNDRGLLMFNFDCLSNGQIPDTGIKWITGFIIFIGILSVILAAYLQIRSIKRSSNQELMERIEDEKEKVKREVNIDVTLQQMRESIDRMSDSINSLRADTMTQICNLVAKVDKHDREIIILEESIKTAHNKINEHKALDHHGKERKE